MSEEYNELIKVVKASGNMIAISFLDLLLGTAEVGEDTDVEELRNVVLSSGSEEATDELVVLLNKVWSNYDLSELLCAIIESKISSKDGSLTETSKRIQEAIKQNYGVA